MKKYLTILFIIPLFSAAWIGCSKSDSTAPEEDYLLKGSYFNSSTSEGIQIKNDKNIYSLSVDDEGCLTNNGTEIIGKILTAQGDKITVIDHKSLDDTLSGTFTLADEKLTFVYYTKNGDSLSSPIIKAYDKKDIGQRVLFNKYMSASIDGDVFSATSVTISYSNKTLIVSGSDPLNGSMSIRVTIDGLGFYNFTSQDKGAYINSSITYQTQGENTGEVKIDYYDTTEKYIAGTFKFNAVSNQGATIEVKSGKFGGKF